MRIPRNQSKPREVVSTITEAYKILNTEAFRRVCTYNDGTREIIAWGWTPDEMWDAVISEHKSL